jgi:ABC-2 type transport system permease protein
VLLILPEDFSVAIQSARQGKNLPSTPVTISGDLTNPYYAIAAVMVSTALEETVVKLTGQKRPIQLVEAALGTSAARSEFEVYVPGLLVFAVILLVFLASMTVAREVEAGTLRRLQITRMASLDYLGGVSLALILVAVASAILAFLTALALGFRSQGSVLLAVLICSVSSLSVIGVGLVIACFSRTVTQAFLLANFPLGLFMFFSGAVFPVPRVTLFTLAGRSVGLYDILPPTHAVVALNKILTLGAGAGDVVYELAALLVLSVLYFSIGVWLFQRTHLRAG